jgi:hypothetical protein
MSRPTGRRDSAMKESASREEAYEQNASTRKTIREACK